MHIEVLIWTDRNWTQWTNLRWLHDTHPGRGLWCFAAGAPREISLPLSTHMLWVWCNFEGYKYFLLDWPCDHMLFTNISLNTFLCSHGTYQQLIKHVNTSKEIFTVKFWCWVLQYWQHHLSLADVSYGICSHVPLARFQFYWPSECNINQHILFCFHLQPFGRFCVSSQSSCSRTLWSVLMLLSCSF